MVKMDQSVTRPFKAAREHGGDYMITPDNLEQAWARHPHLPSPHVTDEEAQRSCRCDHVSDSRANHAGGSSRPHPDIPGAPTVPPASVPNDQ